MTETNKSPESEIEVPAELETEVSVAAAEEGGESPAGLPSVEELVAQLTQAQGKAEENWEQVLRMQAELENTRRRAQRDVESAHKFALEKFALELLPVKDSLEMGLAAAQGSDHEIAEKLREGTELTLKMLATAMEKFGIKVVDPMGEPFNPEQHQAVSMMPSEEHKSNTVIAVMQKGYLLNERLIRPAMVVVSH